MSDCIGLWELWNVPTEVVVVFIVVSIAFVAMPFLGGQDLPSVGRIPAAPNPWLWFAIGIVILICGILGFTVRILDCERGCKQEVEIISPTENAQVDPVILEVRICAATIPSGKEIRVAVYSPLTDTYTLQTAKPIKDTDNIWVLKNIRIGQPEDWFATFDIVALIHDSDAGTTVSLEDEVDRITVVRRSRFSQPRR